MSETLRFPNVGATPSNKTQPSEADQIITLVQSSNSIPLGGAGAYIDIAPWKSINAGSEVPYIDIVIEFQFAGPLDPAPSGFLIGDGTSLTSIGLFGQITRPYPRGNPMPNQVGGITPRNFLLGRLGFAQGTVAPTVPIIDATTGWAQEVCNVGVYDKLAIGGLNSVVIVPNDYVINVTARPIRRRVFGG